MKKLVRESVNNKLSPIIIKDTETKSKWVCEETDEEFKEFIEEELENSEDYHSFMEAHKTENPAVIKCENIPCFAGDDIFVIYFPKSGECASTFDGYIAIHEKPFKTLRDALQKILIEGYADED